MANLPVWPNSRKRSTFMRWVVKRGVSVKRFDFEDPSFFLSFACQAEIDVMRTETKAFFDATGASLEALLTDWASGMTGALEYVSQHCTQLKLLAAKGHPRCESDQSYLAPLVIACAQTLERLDIQVMTSEMVLPELWLPKLRVLHLLHAYCDLSTISTTLSHCPLLVSFLCTDLGGQDDCLVALASHCPLLKVLGFANSSGKTEALITLLQACPLLEVVDLTPAECKNESVNDAQIEAIAKYGANIRALRFSGKYSVDVTDASLASLAQMQHLSRLQIRCTYLQAGRALELLRSSPQFGANMEELELIGVTGSSFVMQAVAGLLSALPHLRVLCLSDCFSLCAQFARTPGKSAALEVLRLSRRTYLADTAIDQLAEKCPVLRELNLGGDAEDLCTSIVQQLWCLLRPQLQISVHRDRKIPGFWRDLADITKT
jgi:hypothetical protein